MLKKLKSRLSEKFLIADFRFIILFSLFILHSSLLISQDTWIHTYSPFYINDGWYDVEDVIICQDGGYAVNGTYVNYDAEMGIEWAHWGFLIKTDSAGNLLWSKKDDVSFMSENESAAFVQTEDRGFISAVFSDWGGTALIKRDSAGSREWAIDGEDLYVGSMSNTSAGNIILGGRYETFPTIRKITEDGQILWTRDYYLSGSGSGKIKSIIQTSDNGFVATGYTSGNGLDLFVLKTEENGDSLWCFSYDGSGDWDQGNSITQNNNDELVVCGLTMINTNSHGLLAKLNIEGDTLWTECVNDSIGYEQYSIIYLADDSFAATCNSSAGAKVYNFHSNYLINWTSNLDGWIAIGDKGLNNLPEGGYIAGGTYPWFSNIILTKTDSLGQYLDVDQNVFQASTLKCYPNPLKNSATITYSLRRESDICLNVYNIKGQLIETIIDVLAAPGEYSVNWKPNNYGTGVYFINLSNDKGISKTTKIIIIK